MPTPQAMTALGNGRWRLLAAVAILVVTALAVVLTRGTSNAEAPLAGPGPASASATDVPFLQLMISMNNRGLALYVLLQNDSPALAEMAGQLAESHRAELRDMRVVLSDLGVMEDSSLYPGDRLPCITGDDLIAVHRSPAATRDALAIALIHRHLTQGALVARGEERSGTTTAAKDLAGSIQRTRTAQLTSLGALPTATTSPPTPG